MNYVLVYKDTKKNINYYYNFNDKLVYANDNKDNNCNIVGVIGIIFGVVITFIANSTIRDIFKEKGKKVSLDKLREMYKKNKSFRIKYFILLIAFFILTILNLVLYQNITTINCILFTSVIMTTSLLLLYRALNTLKLTKLIF